MRKLIKALEAETSSADVLTRLLQTAEPQIYNPKTQEELAKNAKRLLSECLAGKSNPENIKTLSVLLSKITDKKSLEDLLSQNIFTIPSNPSNGIIRGHIFRTIIQFPELLNPENTNDLGLIRCHATYYRNLEYAANKEFKTAYKLAGKALGVIATSAKISKNKVKEIINHLIENVDWSNSYENESGLNIIINKARCSEDIMPVIQGLLEYGRNSNVLRDVFSSLAVKVSTLPEAEIKKIVDFLAEETKEPKNKIAEALLEKVIEKFSHEEKIKFAQNKLLLEDSSLSLRLTVYKILHNMAANVNETIPKTLIDSLMHILLWKDDCEADAIYFVLREMVSNKKITEEEIKGHTDRLINTIIYGDWDNSANDYQKRLEKIIKNCSNEKKLEVAFSLLNLKKTQKNYFAYRMLGEMTQAGTIPLEKIKDVVSVFVTALTSLSEYYRDEGQIVVLLDGLPYQEQLSFAVDFIVRNFSDSLPYKSCKILTRITTDSIIEADKLNQLINTLLCKIKEGQPSNAAKALAALIKAEKVSSEKLNEAIEIMREKIKHNNNSSSIKENVCDALIALVKAGKIPNEKLIPITEELTKIALSVLSKFLNGEALSTTLSLEFFSVLVANIEDKKPFIEMLSKNVLAIGMFTSKEVKSRIFLTVIKFPDLLNLAGANYLIERLQNKEAFFNTGVDDSNDSAAHYELAHTTR